MIAKGELLLSIVNIINPKVVIIYYNFIIRDDTILMKPANRIQMKYISLQILYNM